MTRTLKIALVTAGLILMTAPLVGQVPSIASRGPGPGTVAPAAGPVPAETRTWNAPPALEKEGAAEACPIPKS